MYLGKLNIRNLEPALYREALTTVRLEIKELRKPGHFQSFHLIGSNRRRREKLFLMFSLSPFQLPVSDPFFPCPSSIHSAPVFSVFLREKKLHAQAGDAVSFHAWTAYIALYSSQFSRISKIYRAFHIFPFHLALNHKTP